MTITIASAKDSTEFEKSRSYILFINSNGLEILEIVHFEL